MEFEKYQIQIKPIGFGSYGKVYKGKIKETGEDIAVKLISKVSSVCTRLGVKVTIQR